MEVWAHPVGQSPRIVMDKSVNGNKSTAQKGIPIFVDGIGFMATSVGAQPHRLWRAVSTPTIPCHRKRSDQGIFIFPTDDSVNSILAVADEI